MNRRSGPSGRVSVGLMLGLSLLFALWLLLPSRGPIRDQVQVRAAAVEETRSLTGRNEAWRTALELLPGEKLDLNSATAEELQKLPGLGEKLSHAIVDYRQEHGPFASTEDLLRVPGIGQKRLEAIRELVYIG